MSGTAGRPSVDRDNEFVRTVNRLVNASTKTQTDIAEEIGYQNQNMITMFKLGRTRVPVEKVAPLARALGTDVGAFVRMWFEVYQPGTLAMLEPLMKGTLLSNRERGWITGLRQDFGNDLPVYDRDLIKTVVEPA